VASATAISSTPGDAAQTVEKLVPYAMKKWGKKVYVIAADYNYGRSLAMGEEIRHRKWREVSSIDFFPLDVTNFGSTSPIQAAKRIRMVSAGWRRAYIFLPPVGRGRHAQEHSDASTTFAVGNGTSCCRPTNATLLVCYNYFQD